MDIKRGDILLADLSPVKGSEQGGVRPVLVIQNNIGNKYSPTVIVCAITAKLQKTKVPTHVVIKSEKHGLSKVSFALLEQLRTIDKTRISKKIGHIDDESMRKVDDALLLSVGLVDAGLHNSNTTDELVESSNEEFKECELVEDFTNSFSYDSEFDFGFD